MNRAVCALGQAARTSPPLNLDKARPEWHGRGGPRQPLNSGHGDFVHQTSVKHQVKPSGRSSYCGIKYDAFRFICCRSLLPRVTRLSREPADLGAPVNAAAADEVIEWSTILADGA
jgi:hypothetical protein